MIVGSDKVREIRKLARMNCSPYTIATRLNLSRKTVVNVLDDPTYVGITPTPTAAQVLQDLAKPVTPVEHEIAQLEKKIAELKSAKPAPKRVVDQVQEAECLPVVNGNAPAVTLNPLKPQQCDFRFTVSHRPPNAGFPDRSTPSYPSTADGTDFNLFSGRAK